MDEPVPLYASAYAGYGIREQVRQLTYGDDVGQSGWVTADELDRFRGLARLDADSRLLDVGCGSAGRLCAWPSGPGRVVGVDLLEEGIATATRLAEERGLSDRARFVRADAGSPLPFAEGPFDSVVSIDVMCHLPDRRKILQEWHRVTSPGSSDPLHRPDDRHRTRHRQRDRDRSTVGIYVFSAESVNETVLAEAGFEVERREDLTENMSAMAGRWHDARERFRDDLLADEGVATFEGIQRFLAACHLLAKERRLSRYAYLARR